MFPFYKEETKPFQVKCETCKHWVDKEDCQEVKDPDDNHFYCPMHKKPYDGIKRELLFVSIYSGYHWGKITGYYKTIPAHEVEVDEEGKEITKKK